MANWFVPHQSHTQNSFIHLFYIYLFPVQFSCHINQPRDLGYPHTHFKVPSTSLLSAIHSALIPLFDFFNKIL